VNTLEIEESWTGKYLWRYKSSNGKIVSHGEEYNSKQSAIDGALVGSPVYAISADKQDVMWYTEVGSDDEPVSVEGRVSWIKTNPPVPRPGVPVIGPTPTEVIYEVDGNSLRRDDSGHFIFENYLVLHPKHPDEPRCAIPSCLMVMEVI
jgi:uncharacterized protein YegP (UPF0339 family)